MKYTKYFAAMRRENGPPNLSPEQDLRYFNIIAVENRIEGINIIRRKLSGTKDGHKYDLDYFRLQKALTDLTGNESPEKLLEQMFLYSQQ